ncbi:maleylpyruvate isomerase N-terminal domain-containing protein [Micromonospora sp. WMMD1102]|uniref:maleylpyruvate isomerase N-terminal domain-containing protein n=1 Tax=Micromonospora sp. WMMD1102 TaxID=3016105 RepID=UPI002415687B|nr:maleylpyruvate isomerase N-terminal domain-containing protein [Micromonospora sp. WMMD1102]MDG4790339.1 maleylpyruvate isomerase N-terminal domain-containing protein [Micromonospora sp. WMMD1102]
MRLLECLAADQARLRQVAATDLAAAVPACPDWTVADLVRHVAVTYLHKVECMRTGRIPSSWPPDVSAEEPLPLFDRACRALGTEFDGRDPAALAPTWYDPDQTVGFWLRRMTQETVIHRVDMELATGRSVAEIPADLATDGIDEVLRLFLGYRSRRWPEDFAEVLPESAVEILAAAGPASWLVRLGPEGATVAPDRAVALGATIPAAPSRSASAGPAATVSASPDRMLLWLWRRRADDAIGWSGDRAAVDRLRLALAPATR